MTGVSSYSAEPINKTAPLPKSFSKLLTNVFNGFVFCDMRLHSCRPSQQFACHSIFPRVFPNAPRRKPGEEVANSPSPLSTGGEAGDAVVEAILVAQAACFGAAVAAAG